VEIDLEISGEVKVPKEKLLQYLLLPRDEDDKSEFLKIAGYKLSNWQRLRKDLYELVKENEVTNTEQSPYGVKYEIQGRLEGPNGKKLNVVSIWIKLRGKKELRFVTLFPDTEVHEQ